MSEFFLDLRGVACPMNYVKTKLSLDKMSAGEKIEVLLDEGEPIESVCNSVAADGHKIVDNHQEAEGYFRLTICKK